MRKRKKTLNEEHLVFTGCGTSGHFRGGGERGYDGGEDDVWALGSVDGRVQTPGTVVLHQRGRLPVVGFQARAQGVLVVIAAADQWFTRHLSAEKKRKHIRLIRNSVFF